MATKTVKGEAAKSAVVAPKQSSASKRAIAVKAKSDLYEPLLPDFFEHLRSGGCVAAFARSKGVSAAALRSYAWKNYRDEYEKAQKESADAVAEQAVAASTAASAAQETIETTYSDGSKTVAVRTDNKKQNKKN